MQMPRAMGDESIDHRAHAATDATARKAPAGAAARPAGHFGLLLIARVVGIYARRRSAE